MKVSKDGARVAKRLTLCFAPFGASLFVLVLAKYSGYHFQVSTLWLLGVTWLVTAVILYGVGWLTVRLADWREK